MLYGFPACRRRATRSLTTSALELAQNLGYPVVIKPDDQEQGRGVSAGLRDDAALVTAYQAAREHSSTRGPSWWRRIMMVRTIG